MASNTSCCYGSQIGKVAELPGVEVQALRKWEGSGELIPDRRSKGGTRYDDRAKVLGLGSEGMPTTGYARVSSHDQKADLVRQSELLEAFCVAKGWRHEVIADLGSGLNSGQERPQPAPRPDPAQTHPAVGADPQGPIAAVWFGADLRAVQAAEHRNRHHQQRQAAEL